MVKFYRWTLGQPERVRIHVGGPHTRVLVVAGSTSGLIDCTPNRLLLAMWYRKMGDGGSGEAVCQRCLADADTSSRCTSRRTRSSDGSTANLFDATTMKMLSGRSTYQARLSAGYGNYCGFLKALTGKLCHDQATRQ